MIIVIIVSLMTMIFCGSYLLYSYHMLKKYDVASFKLGKFEIPTFNSALKSKKKLIVAKKEGNTTVLKYDIKKIKLNDVYAYLEKLSAKGFVVVNLEDAYIRTIDRDNDIQIRIKMTSNHLVFEYNIGIDYSEETSAEKSAKEESKEENEDTSKVEEKKE